MNPHEAWFLITMTNRKTDCIFYKKCCSESHLPLWWMGGKADILLRPDSTGATVENEYVIIYVEKIVEPRRIVRESIVN